MKLLFLCSDVAVRGLMAPALSECLFSETFVEGDWDGIIRWGNLTGDDGMIPVLNPKEGIEAVSSRADTYRRLRVNGIPCVPLRKSTQDGVTTWTPAKIAVEARYRVVIFDLRPLYILKRVGKRYVPARGLDKRRKLKLIELSQRSIYACSLHFGSVDVGLGKDSHFIVLDMAPTPKLSPALASQFAQNIRRFFGLKIEQASPTFMRDGTEVTLGADPEFMLLSRSGKMVVASSFFPRNGVIGCDARAVGRPRQFPLAEVRPAPAASPIRLTKNITSCLVKADHMVDKDVAWLAGSLPFQNFPTGGHIHFSKIPLTTDLVRALDNYLAIPLLLLEDPARARKRRPEYGALGTIRVKPHGGFEYRTLSSWIITPKVARAVLCLAKIISMEYPRLRQSHLTTVEAQRDFYRVRKNTFREIYPQLWTDLTTTISYARYAEEVDILRRMIVRKRRWKESVNIRSQWISR